MLTKLAFCRKCDLPYAKYKPLFTEVPVCRCEVPTIYYVSKYVSPPDGYKATRRGNKVILEGPTRIVVTINPPTQDDTYEQVYP